MMEVSSKIGTITTNNDHDEQVDDDDDVTTNKTDWHNRCRLCTQQIVMDKVSSSEGHQHYINVWCCDCCTTTKNDNLLCMDCVQTSDGNNKNGFVKLLPQECSAVTTNANPSSPSSSSRHHHQQHYIGKCGKCRLSWIKISVGTSSGSVTASVIDTVGYCTSCRTNDVTLVHNVQEPETSSMAGSSCMTPMRKTSQASNTVNKSNSTDVPKKGLCDACYLGHYFPLKYECQHCLVSNQLLYHPMYRYQPNSVEDFGTRLWACRSCRTFSKWRINQDQINLIPAFDIPLGWNKNPSTKRLLARLSNNKRNHHSKTTSPVAKNKKLATGSTDISSNDETMSTSLSTKMSPTMEKNLNRFTLNSVVTASTTMTDDENDNDDDRSDASSAVLFPPKKLSVANTYTTAMDVDDDEDTTYKSPTKEEEENGNSTDKNKRRDGLMRQNTMTPTSMGPLTELSALVSHSNSMNTSSSSSPNRPGLLNNVSSSDDSSCYCSESDEFPTPARKRGGGGGVGPYGSKNNKGGIPRSVSGGGLPDVELELTAECDIVEILKEGWLDKKGSGQDWLGSTEWKPRWAVLAMTKVTGAKQLQQYLIPVLHLYWHQTFSTYPTTSISLEYAAILKGNKRTDIQNSYSFEIVPIDEDGEPMPSATKEQQPNGEGKEHRIFAVNLKERNEWMKVMNDAIDNLRRQKREGKTLHFLSPPRAK